MLLYTTTNADMLGLSQSACPEVKGLVDLFLPCYTPRCKLFWIEECSIEYNGLLRSERLATVNYAKAWPVLWGRTLDVFLSSQKSSELMR